LNHFTIIWGLEVDSEGIRQKIRSIFYADLKKWAFKGTLNYLKQNTRSDKSFTLNCYIFEIH